MTILISPSTSQINRYPAIQSFKKPLLQNSISEQDSVHFQGKEKILQKTVSGVRKIDPDTKKERQVQGNY